jgi:hypothetical protein
LLNLSYHILETYSPNKKKDIMATLGVIEVTIISESYIINEGT